MKTATLSGRKRTKDLSKDISKEIIMDNFIKNESSLHNKNPDPVITKKKQLNKLKSEVDIKASYVKTNEKSTNNQTNKTKHARIKSPNLKIKIATLVRVYKSNAQAGTRSSLKYTLGQQKKILLNKISNYVKEYSEYLDSVGCSRPDNKLKSQDYANEIYSALSKVGAPISTLVVTDPLS